MNGSRSMNVFRQPTKKIKLAKHQRPMKSLFHLMKSSFAPNFPPGRRKTPRRERSQEKYCSIPVACKMAEWNVGSLCESGLYALAPNCHRAKKLISKSIRWVRTGSWPVMAYIMFHFCPWKDLTVSLKTFSSCDLIYYILRIKFVSLQIPIFNIF